MIVAEATEVRWVMHVAADVAGRRIESVEAPGEGAHPDGATRILVDAFNAVVAEGGWVVLVGAVEGKQTGVRIQNRGSVVHGSDPEPAGSILDQGEEPIPAQ